MADQVPGFSRKTVLAAIDYLPYNQGQFSRFLQDLGPEFYSEIRFEDASVGKRHTDLIYMYDQDPNRKLEDGEYLSDFIVERAATHIPFPNPDNPWVAVGEETPLLKKFKAALERDGYTPVDGVLRRTLPLELGIANAEDEVSRMLSAPGFESARGHLNQALDAHGRGDWAAANSQVRSFYEALLDAFAVAIDPSTAVGSSEARRQRLSTEGFLRTDLNEWSSDGKNFVNGLMKRLHPHGSHPGLSDEADSTFRLHIVLLAARFFLERWVARPT